MIDFTSYTDEQVWQIASVQAHPGSISANAAILAQVEWQRRKRQKALVNYLSNTDTQEMPKAVYIPRDE